MDDEKKRILKMLEEDKINAEEAQKLLDSVGKTGKSREKRILKVVVEEGDKKKVNIKFPLGMAKKLAKIGGVLASRFSPEINQKLEEYDIDLGEIIDTIDDELDEFPMTIVEVEEDNEKVKIWIE